MDFFSYNNTSFMALISLVLFFGLLWYMGVHKFVGKALDDRADGIRGELAEATKLKEEAQALFAEFERKQRDVQEQADEIVARAKSEAEAAAEKAKEDIAHSIERRLKAADEQIAMAEANAVNEVKDKAVAIAVAAAGDLLSSQVSGETAEGLVEAAIKDVGSRLH
ncbi:MAG: ATP F0F1 synthase subunit B [Pseudomonadota bacterium]